MDIKGKQNKGGAYITPCPFNLSLVGVTNFQNTKVEKYVVSKNMQPVINGNLDLTTWAIGVENEFTALAPTQGIKTTLIPTGIGENLYKSLYCNLDVFKI